MYFLSFLFIKLRNYRKLDNLLSMISLLSADIRLIRVQIGFYTHTIPGLQYLGLVYIFEECNINSSNC